MSNFPPTPETMMQQSDDWAYEQRLAGLSEELEQYMLTAYYRGFTIYQQHIQGIGRQIDASGGIDQVKYVSQPGAIFDKTYRNELVCKDGTQIPLSKVVAMPVLSEELRVPEGLIESATRTHEIQLSYGGKYIGKNAEDVFDVDNVWFPNTTNRPFEVILQDPTYFPEDMGITERVVIDPNEPYDPEASIKKPHVVKQSFSLDGKIWRPHYTYDDSEDIPNPYTDPLEYRRWALLGDARLQLEFQAPAMVRGRSNFSDKETVHLAMKTVIKHPGRVNNDKCESTPRDIIDQLKRYIDLQDYCYLEFVPEEVRETVDLEIEQMIRSHTAALPSGEKQPKKKKTKAS